MYYLINVSKKEVFGTCSQEPNLNDLASRNETVFYKEGIEGIEFDRLFPIIENGKVVDIEVLPERSGCDGKEEKAPEV